MDSEEMSLYYRFMDSICSSDPIISFLENYLNYLITDKFYLKNLSGKLLFVMAKLKPLKSAQTSKKLRLKTNLEQN